MNARQALAQAVRLYQDINKYQTMLNLKILELKETLEGFATPIANEEAKKELEKKKEYEAK